MGLAQKSTGHKMGFTRFVEMGRVVVVNYGDDAGKLGMIVDVIDQNRCMVYSPYTSLPRTEMGYKRLSLTDLKVSIQHASTRQPALTSRGSRSWSPRRTPRSKQG